MVVTCVMNVLMSFLQVVEEGEGETKNGAKDGQDWEEVGEDFNV